MKRMRRMVPVLLCLLGSGLFLLPAAAQEPQFRETFDDAQLSGWEHSPEVIASDGVLRVAPGNFAARPGMWYDLDLTLQVRYSGPGETQVMYRASDRGSYALILSEERASLFRTLEPGDRRELAHAEPPLAAEGAWIELWITLAGGQHTIVADDAVLLTAGDDDPLPPGGLVIASHGDRTTEVDEVLLLPTGGAPPSAGPPAAAPATAVPTATPAEGMTWERFLRSLGAEGAPLELDTFAVNLILAVVTSYVLSRVYVHWGSSLSNRRKFAANFMLITVTTTFIILVVRSSVALSLGLVGALSIIRFRAAIKEPEELAYLFFAIALGIGLGDNQRLVTLLSLVVAIAVMGLLHLFRHRQADVNLHLTVSARPPDRVDLHGVMAALEKHTSKLRLLRYDEGSDVVEMSFVVEFAHASDLNQANAALRALAPSLEISFLDNRGVW